MFYPVLKKMENLRNDVYVITICSTKLHVYRRRQANAYYFVSMQHRELYMKTYERFSFADKIHLP